MNTQNTNTQNHNGTVENQIGNAPPPGSTIHPSNHPTIKKSIDPVPSTSLPEPLFSPLPHVKPPHRPRGKVAGLPKVVRIEVNCMLDDGCSYRAIAAKLQEMGYPGFFYQNIQRWKNGGYQQWIREHHECVRAATHRLIQNSRRG